MNAILKLNPITKQDWDRAGRDCGLMSEIIEARIAQTIFIEALWLEVDGVKDTVFVAISDMTDYYYDFSVLDEMLDGREKEEFPTRYFSTDDITLLHEVMADLQRQYWSRFEKAAIA